MTYDNTNTGVPIITPERFKKIMADAWERECNSRRPDYLILGGKTLAQMLKATGAFGHQEDA